MKNRIFAPIFKEWPPRKKSLPNKNLVRMGHFDDASGVNELWLKYAPDYKAFVPLRHPARVMESFRRRTSEMRTYDSFIYQWECMISFAGLCKDIHYLHLDNEDVRYKQANIIMNNLGITHRVDWSVNKESGSRQGTHDIEITEKMLEGIPQEFMDFYEEKAYL